MWRRVFVSLRLFARLFDKIPMIRANVLFPSAVLLVVFPILTQAWPDAQDDGFLVAFGLYCAARICTYWPDLRRKMRPRTSPVMAWMCLVGVAAGIGAVLIWARDPGWCQRVLSVVPLGWALVFALDMFDKSHATARHFWHGLVDERYFPAMTRIMVLFHVSLVLLNETMIRSASLPVWVVFFALFPLLHHILKYAALRTAIFVTPETD